MSVRLKYKLFYFKNDIFRIEEKLFLTIFFPVFVLILSIFDSNIKIYYDLFLNIQMNENIIFNKVCSRICSFINNFRRQNYNLPFTEFNKSFFPTFSAQLKYFLSKIRIFDCSQNFIWFFEYLIEIFRHDEKFHF